MLYCIAQKAEHKGLGLEDNALIELAQKGDALAFEQLITQHYPLLHRFAYRWAGNTRDAEDIAQQASIKLGRAIHTFRFDAAFNSWLYRLVYSCAMDWQRQEARHAPTDLSLANEPKTETPQEENSVFLQQILNHLEQMADGFKETALLVLAEGLNHKEAAYVLDVKESTISWRLHEIRKQLAKKFPGEVSA